MKEQAIRKQEGRKVTALIPIDLDGYVFRNWENGRRSIITGRKVADFSNRKDGAQLPDMALDQLIRALQLDNTGREPLPESKL